MSELAALAQAATEIAAAFGVGGTSWTRTRRSGATPSADASEASATIAGYVQRAQVDRLAALRAGAVVSDAKWVFVGAAGVDLQTHDTIVSATDSTLRFAVLGNVQTDLGVTLAEVAPL